MIIFQTPLGIRFLPDDADLPHERAKVTMQLYDRYTEAQLEEIYGRQDRLAIQALASERKEPR